MSASVTTVQLTLSGQHCSGHLFPPLVLPHSVCVSKSLHGAYDEEGPATHALATTMGCMAQPNTRQQPLQAACSHREFCQSHFCYFSLFHTPSFSPQCSPTTFVFGIHPFSLLKVVYFLSMYICLCILCICVRACTYVCALCTCLVPKEIR